MTLQEHIVYGSLMSMDTKYLMRAYRQAIKIDSLEVTNYIDNGVTINTDFFDIKEGEFYSRIIDRSSIAKKIMESLWKE